MERKLHGERDRRKAKPGLDLFLNATDKDREEARKWLDSLPEKKKSARRDTEETR
jgi:hypothetical protein